MKDIVIDDFQNTVADSLIRHKSIIDIMTKLSESNSRINRAVAKSVTSCGCIKISAKKQKLSPKTSLEHADSHLSYQIEGKPCKNCTDVLEQEIGTTLFYLAALCDATDMNMYDIFLKELDRMKTLGRFSMH